MAVANSKSTIITNRESLPRKPNPRYLDRGIPQQVRAIADVAAADDNDSVYRLFYVPSSALITDIRVANDAITGGTSFNLGVWKIGATAAEDDDILLTAVDMSSARAQLTSLLLETTTIAKSEDPVWKLLAKTEDTNLDYEVNFKAPTVGTGAGKILVVIDFIVP